MMDARITLGLIVCVTGCMGSEAAPTVQELGAASGPQAAAASGCGMGGGPSLEHLGRMIFFDSSLSASNNQACATCHAAQVGWTGPDEVVNRTSAVYEGSIAGRFGERRPPSAAYATRAPRFSYSEQGGFVGGNFTDGRATGWDLGNPAADQARGPFLNPVEQALPDAAGLVQRVCAAHYGRMLTRLVGADACTDVELGYASIARAIAAFEASSAVSSYGSEYDAAERGERALSEVEEQGRQLFEGKAHCAQCHPTQSDRQDAPAVFTDFGFANIGVPKNPDSPAAPGFVDRGLAGHLEKLAAEAGWRSAPYVPAEMAALSAERLTALASESTGKHRVPTLRNVDRRPAAEYVKAYTHNGYFKTLKGLVHFYNTRDVATRCTQALPEAEALAQGCWPEPEVSEHLDERVGDLQLTAAEEDALVAFLATLSDTESTCMMGMQGMGMGMGMHGRHGPP